MAGSVTPSSAAISPYAVSGGLLGLLLGATHPVAVQPLAHPHLGGERLHVVRALVGDHVLGHAEPVLGGELLERGLPVQARPQRGGGLDERVEEPVHDGGGGREAAGEVHGTDHGLDGVGEDRRLLPPSRGLLATAELDVLADADAPTHLGQRPGVDDRRPQLGQPALGEVGVGAVERLGHDHTEHRVAEELQALVGRQPAVLVGVGTMRQRAVEQLGMQLGVPECCPQRGVVGQRTGVRHGQGQRT